MKKPPISPLYKEPKKKRPTFVEDKSSSGHERVGCSRCCKAIVKQPYMTSPSWEQAKHSFKKKHICHKDDTVPNEDLNYDLVIDLSNGPAKGVEMNRKFIADVIEHYGCEDEVIMTEFGKKYVASLKAFKELLTELIGRKPRVKLIYPDPFND